ncbi:TPA: hypothetical protein QCY19_000917 [Bacillus luti]|nr:hypothetical protein [Bacillus luti]
MSDKNSKHVNPCTHHCNFPIAGPQGIPGPGSTLFFSKDQGDAPITIPANSNNFQIMTVIVKTTEHNQLVKLDATVSTEVLPTGGVTNFQYGVRYAIFRDAAVTPLISALQQGNYDRSLGFLLYDWQPNFTFVDTVASPGFHIYRIVATETFPRLNIDSITVRNRGFTATVFPAV